MYSIIVIRKVYFMLNKTIDYYNTNAKKFVEGTLNVDFKATQDKFIAKLPEAGYILDFGCGSGRDTKYFLAKNFKVDAIDGSIELCKIASEYTNIKVCHMYFNELTIVNKYDGIWACSSILQVEKEKLPNILNKMIKALKVNGIIYTSFKIGEGFEIKEGKYYNYLTKNEMIQILRNLNMNVKLIDYFETLPSTKRIAKNTIWGNFIIKKFE